MSKKAPVVQVEATVDGEVLSYQASLGEGTLLEAALAVGVVLPSMCQAGSCSTCRAKLLSGKVTMETNFILDDDEIAAGYVLACQSVAQSEFVSLNFDEQ